MKTLIIPILILFLNISSAQTTKTTNFKRLTVEFVVNRLSSPSTAQLVKYDPPNDALKMLNNAGFHFSDCYKVTRLVIDGQNAFGATIRGYYFIFFVNDTPCHMEPVETFDGLAKYDEGQRRTMLEATLEISGCECKK